MVAKISSIGVCIALIIALQVATLHLLYARSNDNDGSKQRRLASVQLPNQDKPPRMFLGMFETKKELKKRIELMNKHSEAAVNTISDAPTQYYSSFPICSCHIKISFLTPTTAIDIDNNKRTLAQFENQNQYFFTEDIITYNESSDNCKCKALQTFYTAVYVIDAASHKYGIALFRIGKVFHSVNTSP